MLGNVGANGVRTSGIWNMEQFRENDLELVNQSVASGNVVFTGDLNIWEGIFHYKHRHYILVCKR